MKICWNSIDDIEDNTDLRRDKPAAHHVFGIPSTINSANFIYFLSLDKILKQMPTELVTKAANIYTEHALELHRGQGIQN